MYSIQKAIESGREDDVTLFGHQFTIIASRPHSPSRKMMNWTNGCLQKEKEKNQKLSKDENWNFTILIYYHHYSQCILWGHQKHFHQNKIKRETVPHNICVCSFLTCHFYHRYYYVFLLLSYAVWCFQVFFFWIFHHFYECQPQKNGNRASVKEERRRKKKRKNLIRK